MRRTLAIPAALVLSGLRLPAPARAAVSFSGYLKNLYAYTASPISHAPYWSDLSRARLSLESSAGLGESQARLIAHADYDHELRTGSFLQSSDYKAFGLAEPPGYLDMDQTLSRGGSYLYRHRLYRAWAGIGSDDFTARFGRQRIAWGTGKLWNPTDALNPFDPASLERDERRGVDSLYARRSLGVLGQGEAAWALGRDWPSTALLARGRGHWGPADLSVMGGKADSSPSAWMLGSDFAADLLGGGLHGEWSFTEPAIRASYWRALVGYEYAFSSSPPVRWLKDAWVLAEYFDNGAGASNPARYDFSRLLGGKTAALARDYLGFGLAKDIHPLVRFELYSIVNLDDSSFFFGPDLAFNAANNFYISAGLQRFGGAPATEYGRLANIFHLRAQYYF